MRAATRGARGAQPSLPHWATAPAPACLQGFIALDGVSLTVGEVVGDTFCVYLIPETLSVTLFGTRAAGDVINVEIDSQTQAIVDTVERYLAQSGLVPAAMAAAAAKSQ